MRLARTLSISVLAVALTAIPAVADFVNEDWDDSDLGGWQMITNDQFIEVLDSGGAGGGGFLHTYQTTSVYDISGAIQRFAPYVGDYGELGYIAVRCDIKFFAGDVDEVFLRVRYLDSGHNGWILPLTSDFTIGTWHHCSFEFDPDWSDGEAMAAGWSQQANTPSFQETMANVYTVEVRVEGTGTLEVGLDNFQLDDDLVGTASFSWDQVKVLFR